MPLKFKCLDITLIAILSEQRFEKIAQKECFDTIGLHAHDRHTRLYMYAGISFSREEGSCNNATPSRPLFFNNRYI